MQVLEKKMEITASTPCLLLSTVALHGDKAGT